MDCSPPDSSLCGISQTRILEWVAVSFSRGSSWPRNWIYVCGIGRQILYHWGTWEVWHVAICCCRYSVQSLSCVQLFVTPWIAACQTSLSITNSRRLLKLMSIDSVMPSNHLILCHALLLPPSIFPSITVFSNGSILRIRWPKYWSFSFSISLSNEYSGLISFRVDWLELLAVQGDSQESSPTPQFKSINSLALSFLHSPTLTSYMTTGKTITLTRQTFVDKLMSLLFNMLSSLVITFLPRIKRLLISWLQSPSAVTVCSNFGAPQNKVCHCFHCFRIYLPWSDGTGCHDLSFLNVEF